MEKTVRDLESQVQTQQKQLSRYETRLKDVVAAYKGLLKEKEALEASLSVLSSKNSSEESPSTSTRNEGASGTVSEGKPSPAASSADVPSGSESELQTQIATLMNSLATLSAEKSKMEASFQADRKAMRSELKIKDKILADLQEKVSSAASQTKLEVEKVKSKLIIERHEWEKETGNQMSMIRELQKLLNDERHLKENIEMQLNDLRVQLSKAAEGGDGRKSELAAEVEQLRRRLKELQASSKAEDNFAGSEAVLKQLQSEMMNMKRQHAAAIQSEKQRAYRAEERSKSLAAQHEERVANLENRLAELSATVGSYDRLRNMDQENIAKLKERISQLGSGVNEPAVQKSLDLTESVSSPQSKYSNWTVNELLNEILLLKNVLLLENSKLDSPIDISHFYTGAERSEEKCDCKQKREVLLIENQKFLSEIESLKANVETQKSHIKTLQSKVEVLNRNIDEQENELRAKNQERKNELRAERNKWKDAVASMENEFRIRQAELELQLQKQRERSVGLLEEKENEIRTLKTSFDVFMVPAAKFQSARAVEAAESQHNNEESSARRKKLSSSSSSHVSTVQIESDEDLNLAQKGKEPMHMLHYVHELSRKEVEIAALRKARHLAEQTLRQALQDKAASQEELYDKISTLEEQVDRLERCKSREGANLEYLKNVILSFLATHDTDDRRHMINAISAVLEFSPNELKTINGYFNKKDKK